MSSESVSCDELKLTNCRDQGSRRTRARTLTTAIMLSIFGLAGVGCSFPDSNDEADCTLNPWTVNGKLLVLSDSGADVALLADEPWSIGGGSVGGYCKKAFDSLSVAGMIEVARAFSTTVSWAAPTKVPAAQIRIWYDSFPYARWTRFIADDTSNALYCSEVVGDRSKDDIRAIRSISSRNEACEGMGLLDNGAGIGSGLAEGLWPFRDRPPVLSGWYVGGFWIGRVLLALILLALRGLS